MRVRSLFVLGALVAWPLPGSPPEVPARVAAHRDGLLRIGSRSFSVLGSSVVEVGRTSFHCLACHDGTVAREAFSVTGSAAKPAPSGGRGHPVDVPYPTWNDHFRPAASLDPRLVLSDGCVSCVTCHGGADPAKKRLSVPNDRSALCLCCHLK